jgi:cytochrome c oxidase subunit 2
MHKDYGYGLPVDISTYGFQIDRLINILHVFMIVLFIGWFIFFVYLLIRFRARPGQKAQHHVTHFKLPTYLEVGVALTEVVLLVVFSIPFWYHLKKDFPPKDKSLEIRVVAEQFAWNIHYPGKDGVFGKTDAKLMNSSNPVGLDPNDPAGKDDITTINQLHVPVGKPVIAHLTSKDVIHCFALTVMRVKQDVIPGQSIPVWFEAKKAGNFEISCAQLCGLGHYRMRGYFIVDEPAVFNAWMDGEAAKKAA